MNPDIKQIKISEDVFQKRKPKQKSHKMSVLDKQIIEESQSLVYYGFDSGVTDFFSQKPKIKCGSRDWNYSDSELSIENQYSALSALINTNAKNMLHSYPSEFENLIRIQIQQKINGYHSQDIEKSLFDSTKFVDYEYVIRLLHDCNLLCYYCKKPTQLIYSIVRDNKQWTLERLNNHYGHNKDNVVVSCLHCNIHRKTANSEHYVFSKRLKYQGGVIKLNETP